MAGVDWKCCGRKLVCNYPKLRDGSPYQTGRVDVVATREVPCVFVLKRGRDQIDAIQAVQELVMYAVRKSATVSQCIVGFVIYFLLQ